MTTKSARERFFPTPSTPRAVSGQKSTNPHDPFLRSHPSRLGGRHHSQDFVALSTLDKNTGINRPLTQMGYPAFMKRLPMDAHALTAGSITRPGTAEPRVSEERAMIRIENGSIPLIAPTPKRYHHTSPPFNLPDGSFGSDSLDISRDSQLSKSPDNLIEERQEESFKIPFPKKSNVHQRVLGQPDPPQYLPKSLQRRGEPSLMPNDSGEDGSNGSLHRNKKRVREVDEVEDSDVIERNAKRFKTQEDEEDDKISRHESGSPHPDRPGSAVSSAVGSYHGRSNQVVVNTSPAQRLHIERQEIPELNPMITLNGTHVGPPSRKRSEPVGLDKLLGIGSNDLLDQYAGKYEALLKKWSECSVEEWKAGAEEISARFTMMLDFTKDHMDKKLKTYCSINAVLDSHSEILRERDDNMEFARKEAVKKAAKVLG